MLFMNLCFNSMFLHAYKVCAHAFAEHPGFGRAVAAFCGKFPGIYQRDRHFAASDCCFLRCISDYFPEAEEKNAV